MPPVKDRTIEYHTAEGHIEYSEANYTVKEAADLAKKFGAKVVPVKARENEFDNCPACSEASKKYTSLLP